MAAYTPNGKINTQDKKAQLRTSTLFKESDVAKEYRYIQENSQYYEPQRSNTFYFTVENLNLNLADFGINNVDESAEKTLELAVEESSVPGFQINKLTVNRGNGQMHFAGKPTFKDGQLNIHDYIGAYTKELLYAWQRLAYNVKTQKVGLAKDYKRTAYLYELSPDYQIIRKWTLFGCWISDITEPNYNHSSDEARLVNATVVYDYAEPTADPEQF